ncbi:MAG: hypothetical protein Rubg2KO_29200 [Rubricoccaceae bacterium]
MMWRGLLLVGLAVGVASSVHAQAVGSCVTGTAQRVLENSVLQVSVFNTGGLFFGGSTTSGDGYLIPKQNGVSPLFAAGLWLGGRVDGELRVAGARYGGYDFWPGPLEDAERLPADCSAHDRIYVVSREDIRQYYITGTATDDLRDWPHQLGAPVIDGDGDSTNYDLRAGDQPELIGDMAAWWVMNDAGNDHNPGLPLGVEVRVHAFVYGTATPGVINPVLSQTSFYRYEIVNRAGRPIEQMYATLFSDPDLGDAGDDYIGTDTLRHMVFVYNDSNEDSAYGTAPPALGIQILRGPIGLANGRDDNFDGVVDEPDEEMRATSSGTFIGGGPDGTSDPGLPSQYYNYMQGFWGNGTPYYEYRTGFQQAASGARTTRFVYAGDPVTESFWSEVNSDGNGTHNPQGDRRMLVSTGPFRLEPDSSIVLLVAMPYGQGTDHLNSISEMRGYASTLQRVAAAGAFVSSYPVPGAPQPSKPSPKSPLLPTWVRPNPTSGTAEAMLTLRSEAYVRVTIFDTLGRQVQRLVDGVLPEGETALVIPEGLVPGTYALRVEVPGAVKMLTFTVVR